MIDEQSMSNLINQASMEIKKQITHNVGHLNHADSVFFEDLKILNYFEKNPVVLWNFKSNSAILKLMLGIYFLIFLIFCYQTK